MAERSVRSRLHSVGELVMPIYVLLTNTAFEPAEVKAMAQAFEAGRLQAVLSEFQMTLS